MDEKPISFTEYARHRGLTRPTIQQYVDEGKIAAGVFVNPETGHKKIWRDAADKELGFNVDSSAYPQAAENGRKVAKKAPAEKATQAAPRQPPRGDDTDASLVQLKRQTAQIKIQKEAILLKKLKGELLDKKAVQDRLFAFGKMIRDAIMTVPDRVTDDVMAARTRGEVHRLLYSMLEDSLRQLSSIDEIEF